MKSWYQITARWVAMGLGQQHYSTGRPCRRGHAGPRRTSDASCVECSTLMARSRYWRDENERERHKAASTAWREANLQKSLVRVRKWRDANRERVNLLAKRWSRENPERKRELLRNWHAKNPKKSREYQIRWERKYPGATSLYTMRRLARKWGAEGFHTLKDIRTILEHQEYTCAYMPHNFSWCRRWFDKYNPAHIDHIVALSKGGADHAGNLQALCGPCNIRKFNKEEAEFLRSNGAAA